MTLRTATLDDLAELEAVMKASSAELGARYYSPELVERLIRFLAIPDPVIIGDGTYFAVEVEGRIAGCGGWSRRKKLFTGATAEEAKAEAWADPAVDAGKIRAFFVHPDFARRGIGRQLLEASERGAREAGFCRAELMALLPGVPLYEAGGYQVVRPEDVVLPDGVILPCVWMERNL